MILSVLEREKVIVWRHIDFSENDYIVEMDLLKIKIGYD